MKAERVPPLEGACRELFQFNVVFHVKHGYVPLNVEKALAAAWAIASDGGAFVVRDEAGAIVGSVGLFMSEIYYSDAAILSNRWLNVLPGRHEAGAFRALLEAARDEARSRSAEWLILNRSYHKTELRSVFGRVSESVGFQPFGHGTRIRLTPLGGGDGGRPREKERDHD